MRIFYDIEFSQLRKDTTLISIGLISEDNRQFYAELTDYNKSLCNDWIQENIINNLECEKEEKSYIPNYHIGTKENIRLALLNWLSQFKTVEFVSDVSHYDMVLLIDLLCDKDIWSLPKNICPCCYDINQDIMRKYNCAMQEAFDKSREDILYQNYKENVIKGDKHNSLYDAKVIRELYQVLNGMDFKEKYKL